MSEHTSQYIDGYNFGVRDRTVDLEPSVSAQLPSHTKDNYMHFYIGVHDGQDAAVNGNSSGGKGDGTNRACPAGHTKEYCAGYEEGYNYDSVALNEW
jgi:hypothetical protein